MTFILLYEIASWTLAACRPVLIIYLIRALIQETGLKICVILPSRQGQTLINSDICRWLGQHPICIDFFQHFPRPLTLPLCLSILLLFAMKDISSGQLISLFRTGERERYLNYSSFSIGTAMHALQYNPHSSANVKRDKTSIKTDKCHRLTLND